MQKTQVAFWQLILVMVGLSACSQSRHSSSEKQAQKTTMVNLEIFQDINTKLYGYRDPKSGQIAIQAKYVAVKPFSHQLAAVCLADTLDNLIAKRWGYINPTGETQVPFIFSEAGSIGDTVKVSDSIQVVAAPVKFLPRLLSTSSQPDENPYYVDMLGNCIPTKEAKTQETYHAQELQKDFATKPMVNIFFEKEGQMRLDDGAKQSINRFLMQSLAAGLIKKVLAGKMTFYLEGSNSSGDADKKMAGLRIQSVIKYLGSQYPSLDAKKFYTFKNLGVIETTFVSEGDRMVHIEFREK
ncbi:hypothetical protein BKI52_40915 [marine bacterium AO1-C]|nr:hypothetical protein BKI52_40915 [marine bacterium AO1-C]